MLSGITINSSPDEYYPIEQMQLMRFNGESRGSSVSIINGEVGHDASR